MKPSRWLLAFLGVGIAILAGCGPDTPTGATLSNDTTGKVYSYTYLCELGTPGYESYCDNFASLGSGGTAFQPCPGALANDVVRCHIWDATLDALIQSGDNTCSAAGNEINNAGETFGFYDTVLVNPQTGARRAAVTDTTTGSVNTTVLATAFDRYIYNPDDPDLYDPDDPGPEQPGFGDVSYDLTVTFVHEVQHRDNHKISEDDAEAVGQYCAGVVRSAELALLPRRLGHVPAGHGAMQRTLPTLAPHRIDSLSPET